MENIDNLFTILTGKQEHENREFYVKMLFILHDYVRDECNEEDLNYLRKNARKFNELQSEMPEPLKFLKNHILMYKKIN